LNLLVPLFFVSIAESVDHAFPHGHPDFQAIVVIKSRRSRHSLCYAFGQLDAVEQRLHGYFDPVGTVRHTVYFGILATE
jgi:hypothetical protein